MKEKITVQKFIPRVFTAEDLRNNPCLVKGHDTIRPSRDFAYCVNCDWSQGS